MACWPAGVQPVGEVSPGIIDQSLIGDVAGSADAAGPAGMTARAASAPAPTSAETIGAVCGARAGSLSVIDNDDSSPALSAGRIVTVCTGVGNAVAADGAALDVAATV